MTDKTETQEYVANTKDPLWVILTVAAIFGLLYAYAVWSGIDTLTYQVRSLSLDGRGLNAEGWAAWLILILVPALIYVCVLIGGFKQRFWDLAVMFLLGLACSAALWMSILGYIFLNSENLVTLP